MYWACSSARVELSLVGMVMLISALYSSGMVSMHMAKHKCLASLGSMARQRDLRVFWLGRVPDVSLVIVAGDTPATFARAELLPSNEAAIIDFRVLLVLLMFYI